MSGPPHVQAGRLIGEGRTSRVFEWGRGAVIKVPHQWVPEHWAEVEAVLANAVVERGVSAPAVRDVVDFEGRRAIVFERVDGPTMWSRMVERPGDVPAMVREFVELQQSIHAIGPVGGLPDVLERMRGKIAEADELGEPERAEAAMITARLPRGAALLHGDLHPGNILVGPAGLVTIDWFDAAIGHPVADVVRTSIMCRPTRPGVEIPYLPGASAATMAQIHGLYVEQFVATLGRVGAQLREWEMVTAVSRLSERADADAPHLVRLWTDRHQPDWVSPLAACVD